MNLLEIKERLAQFVRTFARNDVQLLVQFMELTVMEYKRNPVTFFGNTKSCTNNSTQLQLHSWSNTHSYHIK